MSFSIEESIFINNFKKEEVFNILWDAENFPHFMPFINKIELKEEKNNIRKYYWEIDIEGGTLNWLEEREYNDSLNTIKFKNLEGDFKQYEGKWEIINQLNCEKIIYQASIDFGVPTFEKFSKGIFRYKTKFFIKTMLKAIKKHFCLIRNK